MKFVHAHIKISEENKRFVEELARKLGTTQNMIYEIAIWILRLLLQGVSTKELKMYVEPQLIKQLYENVVEYRNVFRKICEELGYVV